MLLPKTKQKSSTLFFIAGPVPTPEEKAQALKLNARMRNAESYSDEDALEPADFLAGAVPSGIVARMAAVGLKTEIISAPAIEAAAPEPVVTEVTETAPVSTATETAAPATEPEAQAPVEPEPIKAKAKKGKKTSR